MAEANKEWKLPKNVRQIGDGSAEKKIYVEDYVMTFLEKISAEGKPGKAILLGEVRELEGQSYIFADSALEVETFSPDSSTREELKKKAEKYFGEKQVVGWYRVSQESPFVMNSTIVEIFEREFRQENQVLIIGDLEEQENLFFLLEEEQVVQQPGYYIYYEKNASMQEYMISGSEGESVEKEAPIKDDAIKRFRKIIKEKQKLPQMKLPSNGRLAYLAGGFLVVTVLSLGATMVYNYDKMKEVERSLAKLTDNVDSQSQYLDEESQAAQVMLHMDETMKVMETEILTETEVMENDVAASSGTVTGSVESSGEATDVIESSGEVTNTIDSAGEAAEAPKQSESEDVSADRTEGQGEADIQSEEKNEVPASTPGRASYTVKVGDTLADISQMYYGNLEKVAEICSLNGIDDENTILPGQKILLP